MESAMSKEYTKQDLIDLVQSLKDYTHESRNILGNDEREAEEFVNIFLNKKEEESKRSGRMTVNMNDIRITLYKATEALIHTLESNKHGFSTIELDISDIEYDVNTIRRMASLLMGCYEEGNNDFKNLSGKYESLIPFNDKGQL